ncbi:MAG: Asp23/Gls24 family envelope stress response protein [Oscillospiraceae bacterium]|nr:Asp23/Gls24 family envelope stress response protein [Oscillospiraceae bacterium]
MSESRDSVIHLENYGSIHISEDVVATIAALAVCETDGASAMTVSGAGIDLLGKRNPTKGIKVTMDDKTVHIDVYIAVTYGKAIPKAAKQVQERVRESIESMTGLTVGGINVHVNGVSFSKEKK